MVNDGSTDETGQVLQGYKDARIQVIAHQKSVGITKSRQEALVASSGEYIAILDDDDEWVDKDKLATQVKYLDEHKGCVLVGGGRVNVSSQGYKDTRMHLRPKTDAEIRRTMLVRNNFFTSTVMFSRVAAVRAGGFIYPVRDDMSALPGNLTNSLQENNGSFKTSKISNGASDADDFAEDYDLWLRLGKLGQMYNFPQVFTAYRVPNYNKVKNKAFLRKQLRLIKRDKGSYPLYYLAVILLRLRLFL